MACGREIWYVFLVHLFVYFARVNLIRFSLPPGVTGWLRLKTVALPGLSYYFLVRLLNFECYSVCTMMPNVHPK